MGNYREPKPGTVSHCPQCKRGATHYTYPGSVCLACRPIHCEECAKTAERARAEDATR